MTVLLAGISSEPPLRMVAEALDALGAPHVLFNQRLFAEAQIVVELREGIVDGVLDLGDITHSLGGFGGVYTRVMDHQSLPELKDCSEDHPLHGHASRLHNAFNRWCEITPSRVVNRPSANASNASKPFQAQLISRHFRVPQTLVTNDLDQVRAFRSEHRRIVYKSISGHRSIVKELADADSVRLGDLKRCPVQFQEFVPGSDVRVHTLASGEVFGTQVMSQAVDYRYAHRSGGQEAKLARYQLNDDAAVACLSLAKELGLDFAGLDLRVTPDGEIYCLEVNPSPAFSYYEVATGQPIAHALACYLLGASGPHS